jgi:transposase
MELQFADCPECGGPATLLQATEEWEDVPDLSRPSEKTRVLVKVEEFRCQDPACEHEFERIIREGHS